MQLHCHLVKQYKKKAAKEKHCCWPEKSPLRLPCHDRSRIQQIAISIPFLERLFKTDTKSSVSKSSPTNSFHCQTEDSQLLLITFSVPLAGPLGRYATKMRDAVSGTNHRPCAKFQQNPFSSFVGDVSKTHWHTNSKLNIDPLLRGRSQYNRTACKDNYSILTVLANLQWTTTHIFNHAHQHRNSKPIN